MSTSCFDSDFTSQKTKVKKEENFGETQNKKVLLRERKRHTDRGVSSTTRGGVPPPPVGFPLARSDWGVPKVGHPLAGGTPPSWTWLGYPPRCGQTDRHVSIHNLPVVLRTRSVIKFTKLNLIYSF